jgi:ureidoacrylate peracid hydrolase
MIDGIRIDPTRAALVVVDMQNDFCHPEGYYARAGRNVAPVQRIVPNIQRLLAAARAAGMLVVFTATTKRRVNLDAPSIHRLLPSHFQGIGERLTEGSWGVSVIDDLAPREGDPIIAKPSYSGFYGTDLEVILRRRGIKTLLMTGTMTYVCVLHTAMDGFVRDFDVVAVSDGSAGYDEALHESGLRIIELQMGRVVDTDQAIAMIEEPVAAQR